ncbi:dihydrodipicolinate synthase family protein [Frigidibacter sp. ROC022]|uniref:dihydrodipicolinate synthase family protein n=1 Tax=Frigidibacter sp. ROC022 TaxID=2971796 RepID=UPI00215A372F|nr:dihydrodipicolinate synthase family protein [Frigidibacter sp. ROC022]MCR8724670.1 dihydrodipicolinate synthase family protein [Frigidibacter sp. ROC022]
MTGIIPILVTPFDQNGDIDFPSLANLIEFNIAGGVHGLGVANGSELFKLSEAERHELVAFVVKAVAGRVPVVISTGAPGTAVAIAFSQAAEAAGADAVMLMPPDFMPVSPEAVVNHYRAISRSVSIPVVLQDVPMAPIPPTLARRIVTDCPTVKYIKVETFPLTAKVEAMVGADIPGLTILGGAGGAYLIEEMRRGSQGTMPYCSEPASFVEVWNRFRAGDAAGARELFDRRIMGLNRLAAQGPDTQHHLHKQFLVRQGIIRTAHVRSPTEPMDKVTQGEIDELLAYLVPTAVAWTG